MHGTFASSLGRLTRALQMESYPKFHNEVGVSIVRIGCREFKCIGDKPPQDHPHIYLNMGDASSPRQFFPDCTIAMRGYDFREGQVFDNIRKFVSFRRTYIYRRCDFKQTYALKRRRV
jgi:uncharacterized Zn-finger protein